MSPFALKDDYEHAWKMKEQRRKNQEAGRGSRMAKQNRIIGFLKAENSGINSWIDLMDAEKVMLMQRVRDTDLPFCIHVLINKHLHSSSFYVYHEH